MGSLTNFAAALFVCGVNVGMDILFLVQGKSAWWTLDLALFLGLAGWLVWAGNKELKDE